MDSFEKAFKLVIGFEGGYSNDPADSGGETCWGITIAEARRHGYMGDMRLLPIEFAKQVYKKDYWDVHHCDEIVVWSEAAAIELFECGINQGIMTAAKHFQRTLNLLNKNQKYYNNVAPDGQIGSITLGAMHKLSSASDKLVFLKVQNILQGVRYIEICERNESQEVFARGWLSRCSI